MPDAVNFPSLPDCCERHSADDGVQPGRITAARVNGNLLNLGRIHHAISDFKFQISDLAARAPAPAFFNLKSKICNLKSRYAVFAGTDFTQRFKGINSRFMPIGEAEV